MDLPAEIANIITPKESIELFVNGETYSEITIDTLVVTGERVILRRPPVNPERADLVVHRYLDIVGVGLEKGFMRSIIRLRLKTDKESMDSIRLPPKLAEEAFTLIRDKVCGQPR